MSEKVIENNKVSVIGEIISGFTFSHEVFGEGFYLVNVAVSRLSEQADIIPLMISERLLDVKEDYIGCTVEAIGQFRSYNRHEGIKNRLVLSVFVREIHFMEKFTDYTKTNQIFLDGYICKAPVYRKTPLGREIADLLLAVNRPYGKSDYIPCIAWGRNARFDSRWEPECAYGAVCRAGSTPKSSARPSARSGWLTRFPSASWNAGIWKRKRKDAKHRRGCAGGFMYVNRNKDSRSLNRLTCKLHGNVLRLARLYKRC